MTDTLREKLIEELEPVVRAQIDRDKGYSPATMTLVEFATSRATEIVDAILTTLADEEPDGEMVMAAVVSGGIKEEGFYAMEDGNSRLAWKAMTAALKDSGEQR